MTLAQEVNVILRLHRVWLLQVSRTPSHVQTHVKALASTLIGAGEAFATCARGHFLRPRDFLTILVDSADVCHTARR
jgi:hypothetical protein